MESYVIRVYRRAEDDPQRMVGIIEIVQEGRQQRFSSMQELWEILAAGNTRRKVNIARERKPEDR
ncbi:MAG: hypothetical protein M3120_02975 [Pseudomonadota bacterium]|nr:hypothetical protein [Pseudomonadota bacterium]